MARVREFARHEPVFPGNIALVTTYGFRVASLHLRGWGHRFGVGDVAGLGSPVAKLWSPVIVLGSPVGVSRCPVFKLYRRQ